MTFIKGCKDWVPQSGCCSREERPVYKAWGLSFSREGEDERVALVGHRLQEPQACDGLHLVGTNSSSFLRLAHFPVWLLS